MTMGMTLEERANEMQKICRKTCMKKIARKEVPQNYGSDWWNEDLTRAKRAVQRARRRWQTTRTEEDKTILVDLRRAFKRTIKTSKEKHIQNITDAAIDDSPWHRAWAFVTRKRKGIIKKNVKKDDGAYTETEDEANN